MTRSATTHSEDGFGLVELIVAIFLLAIITIALIPALYNGIRYSSQQATTSTATRELNALVEQARQNPTCPTLTAVAASKTFKDGAKQTFTTSGSVGSCSSGSAVTLLLTAKGVTGTTLATMSALVYVP